MKISWGAATHVGRIRQTNEDAFGVCPNSDSSTPDPQRGLFVVADGLGGHAGGEIASRLAVDVLMELYPFPPEDEEQQLMNALQTAHLRIQRKASQNPDLYRMGTTIVAVLVQGEQAFVAHVGDSRVYLIRNRRIRQITRDHTVVEDRLRAGLMNPKEALNHPHRNVLSRALGIDASVEVDHSHLKFLAGDLLMLCSDGLTNMLTDEEILNVILPAPAESPNTATLPQSLIDAANTRGGIDNITVVIVQILADEKRSET